MLVGLPLLLIHPYLAPDQTKKWVLGHQHGASLVAWLRAPSVLPFHITPGHGLSVVELITEPALNIYRLPSAVRKGSK